MCRQALVHARGDLALLVSHASGIHKAANRLQHAAEWVIVLLALLLVSLALLLLSLWLR